MTVNDSVSATASRTSYAEIFEEVIEYLWNTGSYSETTLVPSLEYTYITIGLYTVSLSTIRNGILCDTLVRTDYINVNGVRLVGVVGIAFLPVGTLGVISHEFITNLAITNGLMMLSRQVFGSSKDFVAHRLENQVRNANELIDLRRV